MSQHEPTRAYPERRRGEGRTILEIMRSLKRCVARETFEQLTRGDALRLGDAARGCVL